MSTLVDFEDVLATVSFVMEKNPACKFWTTYQERRYGYSRPTILSTLYTITSPPVPTAHSFTCSRGGVYSAQWFPWRPVTQGRGW